MRRTWSDCVTHLQALPLWSTSAALHSAMPTGSTSRQLPQCRCAALVLAQQMQSMEMVLKCTFFFLWKALDFHSSCLGSTYMYFGRAWSLVNLHSSLTTLYNVLCSYFFSLLFYYYYYYFFLSPVNFFKPSSTLTQLFSFTTSTGLAMIPLAKMVAGCILELSLTPEEFGSPSSAFLIKEQDSKAEPWGIQ